MNVNPYQSPQSADQASDQGAGNSTSILQLLTEIRDAQQELLRIQRDTLQRQRRTWPLVFLCFLPAILLPFFFRYVGRPPIVVPKPIRTMAPPRAVPPPLPTASFLEQDAAAEDR